MKYIVIGAGAGGLVVAIGLAKAGKEVLLVDRGTWGGDCTNFGCIPSKTLIGMAKRGDKDLQKVRQMVAEVRSHEEPKVLEEIGIKTCEGKARFVDAHTIEVNGQTFHGDQIIIATGSSPLIPKEYEGLPFLTNETIFELTEIPKSLGVVGGGPIGCELAQAFARLGSEVTLMHRRPHLLKKEEPEAQEVIAKVFEQEGIHLRLDFQPKSITHDGKFHLDDVTVDQLLVSVGRVPNRDLNLEAAGIDLDRIDAYGRTNVKHIFAIGDVVGKEQFTHCAEHQARAVLTTLITPFKKKVSDQAMPRATYTDPEVASFGPLASEVKGANVYHVPLSENDRAVTQGKTEGFVKVICKGVKGKIIGATIVAPRAGEMLPELSLAAKAKLSIGKIQSLIHPYPTYNLAIRKAGDQWLLQTFVPFLRNPLKYFPWKRFLPLFIIAFLMITAYSLGIQDYLTAEMLKEHHHLLKEFVGRHAILAPILYMAFYAVAVALSLPGGAILSLIGGFLFPIPLSTLYVLVGATVGACAVFLAARTALGDLLRKKAGPFLQKMEGGFQKNAWSYLLFLRFIPLFPFWLVNVAPAFFNVGLLTYAWTTFVGIIPGAYAFTQAGAGLGAILESDEPFSIAAIFNTQIQIALVALAVIALLPIVLKKIFAKKKKK